MMKNLFKICFLLLCVACSTKKIDIPEEVGLTLRMATEGADRFENYIHSLKIYAFRLLADGTYVYDKTLATLDSAGISALQDGSSKGDSKFFETQLGVGKYKLFFIGNANGHLEEELQEGITLPEEVVIPGVPEGEKNVYFLGNVPVTLVTGSIRPVRVTLSRAVSKLILVLKEVPSQLDSVRISLGNIAAHVGIDGSLGMESMEVQHSYRLDSIGVYEKDTVVCQLMTLPTLSGSSPFQLTFKNYLGLEKTKEMPPLVFQPDKYIRVTGTINDDPGAFLSFDVVIYYFIFDYWQDLVLPDFTLDPYN